MKKLIKRILLFLAPILILMALWEYGLSTITNSYSLKSSQLQSQADKIEVLVLGPSYSLRGIDPAYFSMSGYNAANVCQSLFYDTRITIKYLDKMPSLKIVLIDVSDRTLPYEMHNSKTAWRDYFYADYWGIRYPEIKWYDPEIYSQILQYGNHQAWLYALKGFKVNLTPGYLNNGFAGKDVDKSDAWDETVIAARLRRRNELNENVEKKNIDSNVSYLKNLLATLNNRKITPVLFSPPMTDVYSRNEDITKIETLDSVMKNLSNEYHCKYFNYTSDTRFNNSDFRNPTHLNSSGAVKFSKIINEEIIKPYTPSK